MNYLTDFRIAILLLSIFVQYIEPAYTQCNGTLIWSDEFSGSSLDLTKWTYDLGNGCPSLCGWGNSELEYYTNSSNNVRVTGGNLVIEARSESMGGSSFTSGKIKTLGLAGWTYGRFEARMRLPQGRGLWPAFWMLNENNNWPMTGEIDIMEYRGDITNRTSGTLHYGSPWPNNQYDGADYFLPTGDLHDSWHIYAVEWDANEIRWYLDDVRFKTETRTPNSLNPASSDDPWPWDEDFYLILNLAVGGWFPGVTNPADVELTKPTFEIDYVRVYDISSSGNYQVPYSGTPVSFPGRVQAEEFDRGCGDAAFYDTELLNQGGQFRDEKVDIEVTADAGGGYDVGWIQTGEWLEYTVDVPAGGTYDFILRASSGIGGGSARIEMDGITVAGPVAINNTGGWQNWQDFALTNVSLDAGIQVMRIYAVNAGFNLNYIDVSVNTLPIELIAFKAEKLNEANIKLLWTTASENNNSYFEIQRSDDGFYWELIGKMKGSGNSAQINNYVFIDYNQTTLPVTYYRFRQVDFNGDHIYLPVAVVQNESVLSIQISKDKIEVSGSPEECRLELYQSNGRLKASARGYQIAKPESPGIYILKIYQSGGVLIRKIIIQ